MFFHAFISAAVESLQPWEAEVRHTALGTDHRREITVWLAFAPGSRCERPLGLEMQLRPPEGSGLVGGTMFSMRR